VPNLNPPFLTVLFAPFGVFDPLTSYKILSLVTVALLLAALAVVAWELRLSVWATALTAAMMLVSMPFMGTIGLGQIYAVLVLGLALAWVAARRGAMVWTGVFLGLVVAVKPTMAPLLLLPIALRQWPTLFSAVGTGFGATLVGFFVAGPKETFDWLALMRVQEATAYLDNASLPGFVLRMGGPAWLGFLIGGALLAVTFIRARKDVDMALWSFVAATLLFAPIAWHNYLLLCYPGVLVLLKRRHYTASALLLTLPTIGLEWMGQWAGETPTVVALGQSLYVYVHFIFWVGLITSVIKNQPEQPSEPDELDSLTREPAPASH
jgi:alpha-1,2-mannosyltransferase/arabinofuranan 3-O-arabinosyltransferase